jgi:hypothetical protein
MSAVDLGGQCSERGWRGGGGGPVADFASSAPPTQRRKLHRRCGAWEILYMGSSLSASSPWWRSADGGGWWLLLGEALLGSAGLLCAGALLVCSFVLVVLHVFVFGGGRRRRPALVAPGEVSPAAGADQTALASSPRGCLPEAQVRPPLVWASARCRRLAVLRRASCGSAGGWAPLVLGCNSYLFRGLFALWCTAVLVLDVSSVI